MVKYTGKGILDKNIWGYSAIAIIFFSITGHRAVVRDQGALLIRN